VLYVFAPLLPFCTWSGHYEIPYLFPTLMFVDFFGAQGCLGLISVAEISLAPGTARLGAAFSCLHDSANLVFAISLQEDRFSWCNNVMYGWYTQGSASRVTRAFVIYILCQQCTEGSAIKTSTRLSINHHINESPPFNAVSSSRGIVNRLQSPQRVLPPKPIHIIPSSPAHPSLVYSCCQEYLRNRHRDPRSDEPFHQLSTLTMTLYPHLEQVNHDLCASMLGCRWYPFPQPWLPPWLLLEAEDLLVLPLSLAWL